MLWCKVWEFESPHPHYHTGWGQYWKTDNEKFNSGEPGIGMEIAKWLSDDVQAGVTGADTWGTEAVPGEDALEPRVEVRHHRQTT